MSPKIVSDPGSLEAFRAQLKSSGLPFEDLDAGANLLVGYYEQEKLIGTGGIEIYGDYGLMRSVSIIEENRGKKLGAAITQHLINKSKENELRGLYLLTETARDFFLKIGFKVIDRDEVAEVVKVSSEFSHVCPVSAVCMYMDLT